MDFPAAQDEEERKSMRREITAFFFIVLALAIVAFTQTYYAPKVKITSTVEQEQHMMTMMKTNNANWDVSIWIRNPNSHTLSFNDLIPLAYDNKRAISTSATISSFLLGPKEETVVHATVELDLSTTMLQEEVDVGHTFNAVVVATVDRYKKPILWIWGSKLMVAHCEKLKVDFSSNSTIVTTIAAGSIDCQISY